MITVEQAAQLALDVNKGAFTHDIGTVEWDDRVVDGQRTLTFQSSRSLLDWIGNAFAFKTDFLGTRVHTGFLYQALQAYVAIDGAPDILVGSSLGGAIAQLLAVKYQVPCITFGSPRVGNKAFADLVTPLHTRVVNPGDPIPYVPFACWGFRHGGEEMKLGSWRLPWPPRHLMESYIESLRQ